jgi:EF-P beta-lysylation protein EpmB
MIPRINTSLQTPDWQKEMAQAINSPRELLRRLDLPLSLLSAAEKAHRLFPLRVPESYLRRIRRGDIQDPLLRQILPLEQELEKRPDYLPDPVGDYQSNPKQGLLHKYQGRVLLVLTGACAIHCRYCFRRHFDYQNNNPLGQQWRQSLDYIHADESIYEVILSGGDPLSLSDGKLGQIVESLSQIPHLRYLRIHSRLLNTIPQRLTDGLISLLEQSQLGVTLVTHINHAQEIDSELEKTMSRLRTANVTLLNQTVLLKGVNNRLNTLIDLSHSLFSAGILPYYLHLLDKVEGANHFDLDESGAKILYRQLQASLPGYLVPRLVREIPGQPNKTPINMGLDLLSPV